MIANIYNKHGTPHRSKKIIKGSCVFPFKFKGKLYSKCLDTGNGSWCATKTKKNNTIDTWGYCLEDEIKEAANILTTIKYSRTSSNKKKLIIKKKKLIIKKKKTNKLNMDSNPIIFNSKSQTFWQLSNFYGGVESCYMKARFKNPEIKKLFEDFETCNNDKFIYYLKVLQPGKKWTEKKINYWFKDGQPIRGILSKLLGMSVKDSPTGRKRLKIIKEITSIKTNVSINPELTIEKKKQLMLECLRNKYKNPEFKTILLSTENKILHERPMRGKGDNWTYPGGDWLGQLLTKVRTEIMK